MAGSGNGAGADRQGQYENTIEAEFKIAPRLGDAGAMLKAFGWLVVQVFDWFKRRPDVIDYSIHTEYRDEPRRLILTARVTPILRHDCKVLLDETS